MLKFPLTFTFGIFVWHTIINLPSLPDRYKMLLHLLGFHLLKLFSVKIDFALILI